MTDLLRRDFLRTATAAVFASTGLSAAIAADANRASPRPRRKFTKCLSCGAIGVRADQREAIRLAQRFGFESVEPAPDFLAGLSQSQLEELLEDMKGKKLAWGAAGLSVEFRASDAVFQDGMNGLPRMAEKLSRAGVSRVATWLNPCHPSLTYVQNFRQHARRLREVAKVLGEHGQRLGLEYVGPKTSWASARFPFIHTMAEMKDLIAEIGQSNVGFLLDSWHWYTAGESQSDLLTLTSHDVVCVHLNDAPAGIPVDRQIDSKRDLPCATGVIDLKSFLGGLARIGYDGPILIEPFKPQLAAMPAEEAVATTAAAMNKAFSLIE